MEPLETTGMVADLIAGFETLSQEYVKLFGQHQELERKLRTARDQYNALIKLCGSTAIDTPPLSLAPPHEVVIGNDEHLLTSFELLEARDDESSQRSARVVKAGFQSIQRLRARVGRQANVESSKHWGGSNSGVCPAQGTALSSISESRLEQDFTVEGKPSKLGCPFAGMANKKLSSHAASVLSRYNTRDSTGHSSTPLSSVNRVNGKESYARRDSRRQSFVDPIRAEICGISDHQKEPSIIELVPPVREADSVDIGACPIRFLDQHSPEEVATYFEKHKHQLPRSHEVCVKRYQSNEEQIKQLDAKYGNIVSMIQGLGQKHRDLLPEEPDAEEGIEVLQEAVDSEKVRKWASSVSVEASPDAVDAVPEPVDDDDDRQSRFARPLRDVRVGESPSRPWGIPVPAQYFEGTVEKEQDTPNANVTIAESKSPVRPNKAKEDEDQPDKPQGRCPFGFDRAEPLQIEADVKPPPAATFEQQPMPTQAQPIFLQHETKLPEHVRRAAHGESEMPSGGADSRMVFTGPVFVGYSVDDAIKILQATKSAS